MLVTRKPRQSFLGGIRVLGTLVSAFGTQESWSHVGDSGAERAVAY